MSSIITAHPPLIIGRHVLRQRTLYSPEGVFVVPMYIYRDDCGDRWKIEIARDYVKYRKYYTDYAYGDACLLYTSPSPRDRTRSRMPSSA